ncbi:hypothetical protein E3N88_09315 [Mikania micrantha]|uniref:Uncharacterized protein n=1 Tax=Mikania micrantha TaxID=192012 RepID=A0A5N6PIP1_9ASTR|nr:hypothetical protein E3N88_09315 [Mikania micrantha]
MSATSSIDHHHHRWPPSPNHSSTPTLNLPPWWRHRQTSCNGVSYTRCSVQTPAKPRQPHRQSRRRPSFSAPSGADSGGATDSDGARSMVVESLADDGEVGRW